jgi:hypothetical protein
MKPTDTHQNTLWQFTVESSKEAVRLYFEPVQKVLGWLSDSSHKPQPPFDSLEDLKMRFRRLQLEVSIRESTLYTNPLRDIEILLRSSRNLAELQKKIRQMEIDLGFEKNLPSPGAERTRGASGD